MLKTLRIVLNSILWLGVALFLGFAFSEVLLKSFLPDSLAKPGAFISGGVFFFVLRWLRSDDATSQKQPAAQSFPPAQNTAYTASFSLWESLYSTPASLKGAICENDYKARSRRGA